MPLFLGFMGGILTASFWKVGIWWVGGFFTIGFVCFGIRRVCKEYRPSIFLKLMWVGMFILGFAIGTLRFNWNESVHYDGTLESLTSKYIKGKGIVSEESDRRDTSLRLIISIEAIEGLSQNNFKNRILISTNAYSGIRYGDEILFSGVLTKPQNFNTTPTKVFDYVHFLQKDNVYYEIVRPKIFVIAHGHGEWLQATLLEIKYGFINSLAQVIPEPQLSLLGGLFLGTKQSLGTKLLSEFQKAGVVHMVVVSGYNITIVAEAIGSILSFLSLSWRLCFSGISIVLFVLMTGASAASVRAGIMALLAISARFLGRRYNLMRAILLTAFCMVFYNPLLLAFDPSFQLSFLATLALIIVSPFIETRLMFVPVTFGIREIATTTLSVQIFLLPFLLYLTGTFSVVSLPVNALVLFPVPFTMSIGFITGVVGFFSSALTLPIALITHLSLSYILYIVETAANYPFAAVSISYFPFWLTALCYLFYTFILWKLHHTDA